MSLTDEIRRAWQLNHFCSETVEQICDKLTNQEAEVRGLQQQLAEKEEQLKDYLIREDHNAPLLSENNYTLRKKLAEKDKEIDQLNEVIELDDGQVTELNDACLRKDKEIERLREHIRWLDTFGEEGSRAGS